jgi:hypothetical protein
MRERRIASVQLLVVALISLSSALIVLDNSGTANGQSAPQTPAELWLSWSSDAREEYVWGFLSGFLEGKRAGCSFYADKMTPYMPHESVPPEKLPRPTCLNALPDFTDTSSQIYVHEITEYYTKYPRDREAGFSRIMLELASPPGLTIDQIHAKLTGRPKG